MLKQLNAEDLLAAIAPRVSGAKLDRQLKILRALSDNLAEELEDAQINTPLRVAHFLAQLAHESDGFCTTEEYASGAAYEGRMNLGNTQPGDGRRFKGRGPIQLTGRANYATAGKALGLPLVEQPEMAADPAIGLRIACWYWTTRNLNKRADADDLVGVTRIINGGRNGLDDRRKYLGRAKIAMQKEAARAVSEKGGNRVLRRGMSDIADVSTDNSIEILQRCLNAAGYPVAIDGQFGPGTETAVRTFQRKVGLTDDGIVGPKTWEALPVVLDAPAPEPSPMTDPQVEQPATYEGLLDYLRRLFGRA